MYHLATLTIYNTTSNIVSSALIKVCVYIFTQLKCLKMQLKFDLQRNEFVCLC